MKMTCLIFPAPVELSARSAAPLCMYGSEVGAQLTSANADAATQNA
jgi:hypothetical protein